MSRKTLCFDEVETNKNKFHGSKQPIVLNSVDINKIVTSAKFRHGTKGFRYFIGCLDDDVIRPLCIMLPQMSGFLRHFDNGSKNMSFMIKNDRVLIKYNEIWGKINRLLVIKLHSEPIYDDKYIETKVRPFNGEIHTTFWCGKIPNEGIHYTCIRVIMIHSIMKMDRKYFPKCI